MYLKILLNYILGYVNIEVEGFFVERFTNICMSKNIPIWKIIKNKSTIMHARLGVHDYKEATKIAKQTKCKIRIKSKKGLPFLFNKYKKRKIFVALLFSIIIGIIIISNYIWNIEVSGTEKINNREIIELVNREGLSIGKNKRKINTKDIINKIRLERKDIAWVRN